MSIDNLPQNDDMDGDMDSSKPAADLQLGLNPLEDGLSHRQRAFVMAYVENGCNGPKAVVKAGYSDKAPRVQAHRLLHNVNVARAINMELTRHGLSEDECHCLLRELVEADLADFEPYLSGKKTLVELRESGVITRVVKKATVDKGKRTIELYDSVVALDRALRVRGMLTAVESQAANQVLVNISVANVDGAEARKFVESDVVAEGTVPGTNVTPSLPLIADDRDSRTTHPDDDGRA